MSRPPPPRRGLRREEAATFIGVSPSKFNEMVRDGRMPKPLKIDTISVWDRHALDTAFDDLAASTHHAADAAETDRWKAEA